MSGAPENQAPENQAPENQAPENQAPENQAPEPVFTQPWHGQVFALTVHLNEAGQFAWPDWTERFSATLARRGLEKELDGGDDYFAAWLETLEALLADLGQAAPGDVERLRDAWEAAYLSTPHGDPVHLPPGG